MNSLARRGSSELLEIPLVSFLYPYIGTTLRISPLLTSIFREFLILEAGFRERFPVFLIHPNELVSETPDPSVWGRRSINAIEYIFKEKIRTTLKRRNLGENAAKLLERELGYFSKKSYRGVRLVDIYKLITMEKKNE